MPAVMVVETESPPERKEGCREWMAAPVATVRQGAVMERRKVVILAVEVEVAASSALVAVGAVASAPSLRATATPAEIAATPSPCPDR